MFDKHDKKAYLMVELMNCESEKKVMDGCKAFKSYAGVSWTFSMCVYISIYLLEKMLYMLWYEWIDADMFMGFEEIDADDDIREEFPCPFCTEYFDIVGLCCHIDDEHPVEAKNGVLFPSSVVNYIDCSLMSIWSSWKGKKKVFWSLFPWMRYSWLF